MSNLEKDSKKITFKSQLNYTRTVLHKNTEFEVVSCDWSLGALSEIHSHGWSQCHVLIQSGEFKNTHLLGSKQETFIYSAGDVISTPAGAQHQIQCLTENGKTFHIYTPQLSTETEIKNQFSSISPQKIKELIDVELSEFGLPFDELKKLLVDVQKQNVQTHSVYFMNQLFSSVPPENLLAQDVITKSRTTAATFEASPVFTTIEIETIQKLCDLIGWKKDQQDGITISGGSAANFMALHCARQKHNPNYKTMGMAQTKYKIFVSQESHYSFKKACVALGFGLNSLVTVKSHSDGRINLQELESEIKRSITNNEIPLLISATAGTTVLGAFDPIVEIADLCEKYKIWFHVDGAWGGPILFSEKRQQLLPQIERCDSMTFDAHKLLGAQLTCSFFLTQHKGLLFEANDVAGGDYLFHSENGKPDMGRQSWQCGRNPDAFAFWTLWKSQGSLGFKKLIDHLYQVQNETVRWVKEQPRLQLVADPEFLNICVRVLPPSMQPDPHWSAYVRQQLKDQDQAMVNYSHDENGTFLRLILAHPQIQFKHVQQIFEWSLRIQ